MPESLIIILGKPIAKARPRFSRAGQFVKVYSAQSREEKAIAKELKAQWQGEPLKCPVIVYMIFAMPIPKSSRKTTLAMLLGALKHTKRPDCTNLIKFYEDCANGIVWEDDSQIYEVEAKKIYSLKPQTIIRVEW